MHIDSCRLFFVFVFYTNTSWQFSQAFCPVLPYLTPMPGGLLGYPASTRGGALPMPLYVLFCSTAPIVKYAFLNLSHI